MNHPFAALPLNSRRLFRLGRERLTLAALLIAATAGAQSPSELADVVSDGYRDRALALIAEGVDVNGTQADGTTALLWAAHLGDAELVDQLIGAGADANAVNEYGATALAEAAASGDREIVARLLDAGVDPNQTNAEGESALMVVARTGNLDAARSLLAAGADVNAKEQWGGQSALMWAVAQLQPEMVALLIDHGADLDARGTVRHWTRRITAEARPKDMN
jgi:ankyrin repeat protein